VKSVVVDTNVVLSFVTDRDLRQQRAAARLFEHAATGEHRIVLPQVVLIEIIYVLQNLYRTPPAQIAGLLEDLLAMPRLEADNEVAWHAVLEIWPGRVRDFADAVLMNVARTGDHAVATFDRKLGRALRRIGVASHPLR
jgi:predicted nucleic acid-binding protein